MAEVQAVIKSDFKYHNTQQWFEKLAENCGVFWLNASLTFESADTT